MATVEEAIYQTLIGSTMVTALAGSRVYPLRAPQNPVYPLAVYQRVSWLPVGGLEHQITPTARPRLRVRCYGEQYFSQAKALSEAVRKTLDGFTGTVTVGSTAVELQAVTLSYEVDNWEPLSDDRGVYVSILDFTIFNVEST